MGKQVRIIKPGPYFNIVATITHTYRRRGIGGVEDPYHLTVELPTGAWIGLRPLDVQPFPKTDWPIW